MILSIQDNLWWGTQLQLPAWSGYQSRLGAYGSVDKPGPSDGSVTLIFAPEGRGLQPLTEEEMRLVAWFEDNEPNVSEAVKRGVIEWCLPQCSERASRFDFDDEFPVIASDDDLKRNVGLYAINIHQLDSGGVPYVGYEFGCEWDEEHGLGVLTHGAKVVEVGLSDTARLLWIAKEDAENGS